MHASRRLLWDVDLSDAIGATMTAKTRSRQPLRRRPRVDRCPLMRVAGRSARKLPETTACASSRPVLSDQPPLAGRAPVSESQRLLTLRKDRCVAYRGLTLERLREAAVPFQPDQVRGRLRVSADAAFGTDATARSRSTSCCRDCRGKARRQAKIGARGCWRAPTCLISASAYRHC